MGQFVDFGVGVPGLAKQKGQTGIAVSAKVPVQRLGGGKNPWEELGKFSAHPLDYLGNAAKSAGQSVAAPFTDAYQSFMSGFRPSGAAPALGAGAELGAGSGEALMGASGAAGAASTW